MEPQEMERQAADTVIILSSNVIATVMEAYFNAELFRHPVAIVDLQPTETGYMFSLALSGQEALPLHAPAVGHGLNGRDVKGRFMKREM